MPPALPPQRLIVLGSTGSIGRATLEVAAHLRAAGQPVSIVGLAANGQWRLALEQARAHGVRHVALADPQAAERLRAAAPDLHVLAGPQAATTLVETCHREEQASAVAAAIVGAAGLAPTLRAVELGLDIQLSNKETLVVAGRRVMAAAAKSGARILPVDSEHSAVHQALASRLGPDYTRAEVAGAVERIVLTASGGALRDWPPERLPEATADDALRHPTWSMGPKVTVDSATLINKALEVVEAHHLFGLPPEKIEAVVHPQSLVHAFVCFNDGSVVAQLAAPDMRVPIQVAMTWPQVLPAAGRRLNPLELGRLDFQPVDPRRYPCFALGHAAIRGGDEAGAALNGANEAAVADFLAGRIRLGELSTRVQAALAGYL